MAAAAGGAVEHGAGKTEAQSWDGGARSADTDQLIRITQSVCRIMRYGETIGTGFVIGPNRIMTNAHVVPSKTLATITAAVFQIGDEEVEARLNTRVFMKSGNPWEQEGLNSGNVDIEHLDYTIVGCDVSDTIAHLFQDPIALPLRMWEPQPAWRRTYGTCPGLVREPRQTHSYVFGHPLGMHQRFSDGPTKPYHWKSLRIRCDYESAPGSSGSPIVGKLDGEFRIIGLNHAGPRLGARGSALGITAKAILCDLLARRDWADLEGWVPMDRDTLYRAYRFHLKNNYPTETIEKTLRAAAEAGQPLAKACWGTVLLSRDGSSTEGKRLLQESADAGCRFAKIRTGDGESGGGHRASPDTLLELKSHEELADQFLGTKSDDDCVII